MRYRVGPVRFGGGRRPSVTMGVGPVGVTLGGRRKRRSQGKSPYTSSSESYREPSIQELERRHAFAVFQSISDEAKSATHLIEDSLDWPWLDVFVKRCAVMGCFGVLILFTTKNVEHVLALYLAFVSVWTINFAPAAMAYRRTTDPQERRELFDGSDSSIQLARANFSAGFIQVWLLISGAFLIEAFTNLEDEFSDVISLGGTVKVFVVYLFVTFIGVALVTKSRTKSSLLVQEEMKLLVWNHLFVSAPKSSMLRYEVLRLNLEFLKKLSELSDRQSLSDPIYERYRGSSGMYFEGQMLSVSSEIAAFELKLGKTSDGMEKLRLANDMYRDASYAAKLAAEREYLAERSEYWGRLIDEGKKNESNEK